MRCWGQIIRAHSRSLQLEAAFTAATLLVFASTAYAQAESNQAALAKLGRAAAEYERAQYAATLTDLQDLEKQLPTIQDYILYLRAAAHYGAQNYAETANDLTPVWKFVPATPVLPKAVLTAAHAYLEAKQPKDAVDLLRKYIDKLPAAQGMFLLAQAAEASGDPIAAATHYQSVFYWSPTAPEASQAEAALDRLRQTLGENFPPAMPATMLARAEKLMKGGNPRRAKTEFEAIATQVGGGDRDLARVRVGEADYFAKNNESAYDYLKNLTVSSPEGNAERLYYALASARRLNREDEARSIADQLGRDYPKSRWRLEGLLSVSNYFLIQNQPELYQPYFRACIESFPSDPQAAYCHWKLAWTQYLRRQADATAFLREHLVRYPGSEKAAAALYFLGRAAEKTGDAAAARAYYSEILERFPNYFHAVLAAGRMTDPAVKRAASSAIAVQFLKTVRFPPRAPKRVFEPDAPTRLRIERARLLAGAGLDDWADTEMRFAAKTDSLPGAVAIAMGELAESRGAYHKAVHAIKALAPGFLLLPIDAAPEKFWRFAFPLPYRTSVESNAGARSLDPFLVAALIRQESEFDPNVVSAANAYGLTQVLPGTGREISRKLGMRRFTPKMLFDPDTNIRIGTYYLRSLLDQFEGRLEPTLASYNGGKTNVIKWLSFAQYEEPAEFIETIPFTETRNYVQIVLRNAYLYRRLYGSK